MSTEGALVRSPTRPWMPSDRVKGADRMEAQSAGGAVKGAWMAPNQIPARPKGADRMEAQ